MTAVPGDQLIEGRSGASSLLQESSPVASLRSSLSYLDILQSQVIHFPTLEFTLRLDPGPSAGFQADENSGSSLQNSNVPSYQYDARLEGELSPEGGESRQLNTLDEPVKETIKRDVKAVGLKFFHVLYPKQKKALLQDWDLWGPLILCVFLALMLHGSAIDNPSDNDGGLQFAEVFSIVWLGAVIVTLNSKLLGGALSFFQSVCVLGYCLLAPSISLIVCRILNAVSSNSTAIFIIKFFITMLGLGWAVFASVAFLGDSQPSRRKALAVYPIFLFYFAISWLIILHSI